ncbi:MAG: hypothetical protein WA808_09855 [Xanthobacteraceae bacterium]
MQYLPPHWGTLYELTKLDNDQFTAALDARLINVRLTQNVIATQAYAAVNDSQCPNGALKNGHYVCGDMSSNS